MCLRCSLSFPLFCGNDSAVMILYDSSSPWLTKYTPWGLRREFHDDVIKWKHFPCCWPFVRGIHRLPVDSPDKGQWCGALMFSLICAWTNNWANNRDAGDLRRHRAHHHAIVMKFWIPVCYKLTLMVDKLCASYCYASSTQVWLISHCLCLHVGQQSCGIRCTLYNSLNVVT